MTIEEKLGISFRDRSLLSHALIHGSHVNESQGLPTESNERLEFLGDAVIGLIIAEELYRRLPEAAEGTLTSLRSSLVRRQTLATVGRTLRLGDYLLLGKGEAASGGRSRDRNLADTVEAIVGACYLDQGYEPTRTLVLRLFDSHIQEAVTHGTAPNYKAILQEHLQSQGQPVPRYRIVSSTGPDHGKVFTAEVLSHNTPIGSGTGHSRKSAETAAACHALLQLIRKEE